MRQRAAAVASADSEFDYVVVRVVSREIGDEGCARTKAVKRHRQVRRRSVSGNNYDVWNLARGRRDRRITGEVQVVDKDRTVTFKAYPDDIGEIDRAEIGYRDIDADPAVGSDGNRIEVTGLSGAGYGDIEFRGIGRPDINVQEALVGYILRVRGEIDHLEVEVCVLQQLVAANRCRREDCCLAETRVVVRRDIRVFIAEDGSNVSGILGRSHCRFGRLRRHAAGRCLSGIDTNPVDFHRCERRGRTVRIAGEVAAYSKVEENLEWLVERRREVAVCRIPGILRRVKHAVCVPANLGFVPLDGERVEAVRQALGHFVLDSGRLVGREFPAEVNGSENRVTTAKTARTGQAANIDGFHDVNFAAGRESAVETLCRSRALLIVLRKHPERRPNALTGRQLHARLESSVPECVAILRRDARGGETVATDRFAFSVDNEPPAFEPSIIREVVLTLVVAPARDAVLAAVAFFEEPRLGVELRAVELVTPDQCQHVAVGHREARRLRQRRVGNVYVGGRGRVGDRNLNDVDRRQLG